MDGLLGLLDASQPASHDIGSAGLALHSAARPLTNVGDTCLEIYSRGFVGKGSHIAAKKGIDGQRQLH